MSEDFQERRKYVRVYHNFMLFFSVKGKADVSFEMSQINNISRGGINFSSNQFFAKGTELCIDLKTPFQKDAVRLEGVLLACVEKVPGKLYGLHLEFRNISPDAMDILLKTENYVAEQK